MLRLSYGITYHASRVKNIQDTFEMQESRRQKFNSCKSDKIPVFRIGLTGSSAFIYMVKWY